MLRIFFFPFRCVLSLLVELAIQEVSDCSFFWVGWQEMGEMDAFGVDFNVD